MDLLHCRSLKTIMKTSKIVLLVIGCFIFLIVTTNVAISMFSGSGNSDLDKKNRTEIENRDNAAIHAQSLIKNYLKSPSTAKFESSHRSIVVKLPNGNYEVKSHVDSQNGFGAMIRKNWTAEIRYTDSEVQLVDYKFY